mmetsp:Transcript_16956/g.51287  ORF Transcript_16956/g.51287 Transcript_16956/m.51287 type:complete len:209 (-) Transcript_16956:868-1494(-)
MRRMTSSGSLHSGGRRATATSIAERDSRRCSTPRCASRCTTDCPASSASSARTTLRAGDVIAAASSCASFREVPMQATTLEKPAACKDMASMYPSTMTISFFRLAAPRAIDKAYKVSDLRKTADSFEFKYFGAPLSRLLPISPLSPPLPSSISLPPKPTTFPAELRMGMMRRPPKRSKSEPSECRRSDTPASISSSAVKFCCRRVRER